MNYALTTHLQYEQNDLLVRRANYAILKLSLGENGYDENRFAVLEPACQTNLLVVEKRKAQWVQVYLNALAAKVDLETFPDINDCEMGTTDGIATSGTYATLTTALVGNNNDILYTARKRGISGNIIQVQYVDPATPSQPLTFDLVGSLIKVNLRTNASSQIVTTAEEILTGISEASHVKSLVKPVLAAGNNGTGIVTVLAATNLAGGEDF